MTQIALVVHVLGILLWVGGTITAGWTAAGLVASGETKALSSVRSALLAIGAPGILLAFAGGLAQLIPNWSTLYAHAGWMHGKLTIGLVLAGLHGMLIGRVRKAATGEVKTPGVFMGIAVAYAVLALIALGLLMFRPGA
jgi:uncharacterized membrane protein